MLRLGLLLAAAYGLFVLAVWAFQGRLLYQPSAQTGPYPDGRTPAALDIAYDSVTFETGDLVTLHGWFVPAPAERATVLFFHGNAGNVGDRLETVRIFHELGLSVLVFDYRGYGRSEGRPSEVGTARDARAAWGWLRTQMNRRPGEIVIAGRSLGAAVAAELAREHSAAAVILESPLRSVPRLAQQVYPYLPARWLSRFDYPTERYVADIAAPLLIVHARDDEIVPYEHGEAVFAAAGEPKSWLAIEGGHNAGFLVSEERYRRGVDGFLTAAGVPRSATQGRKTESDTGGEGDTRRKAPDAPPGVEGE